MKTLRKCIAFILAAGLLLSAMTVFADGGVSGDVSVESSGTYEGSDEPANSTGQYNWWHNTADDTWHYWDKSASKWVLSTSGSNSSSGSDSESGEPQPLTGEEIAAINERAGAEALQGAASDEGFVDVGDMYRAAEKSMSAGEYYNNVVTDTPGIENAITVGQGGNLVVDGKVTNMSATISKVTNRAYVDSVRIEQDGTVLNVVDVQYPAVEATINFYTPGIEDGMEIVALQYNAGVWVDVEVVEVRADHVVLNMKGNGVVAFIAK